MNERMNDEQQSLEAQLARLADGSLPPARASELRERVAGDPVLAAALAEQQRAVSLLAGIDASAPASLRAHVGELANASPVSRRPRRTRIPALAFGGALTAIAAVAVAITVLLSTGTTTPTALTTPQTVHLALAAATLPSPPADPQQPTRLALRNGGVPFPNWTVTAGWSTAGARADTLDGRRILTVFYTSGASARIGYAIVSGPALRAVSGRVVVRGGVRYTLARSGSAAYVTWVRSGHTCVIAGAAANPGTLLELASYAD